MFCSRLTNPAALILVDDEGAVVGVPLLAAVHVGLQLGQDDGGVAHAEAGGDGRQVHD